MKCVSEKCKKEAKYRVFWPGQMSSMCEECLWRARRVSEAMGFELTYEPLAAKEEKPCQ